MESRFIALLNSRWSCLWVTMITWVIALIAGSFIQPSYHDILFRFAPMAELFAEGEWYEAFHPRFGVLFTILPGCLVWLTNCTGLTACIWVALTLWVWAIPVLFLFMERLFDRKIAWITVGLYIFCPLLFYWSLVGCRESSRTLGLLMATTAIFLRRENQSGWWWMFGALPLLTLFRLDTVLILGVLLLLYAYYDRFRWRTWSLITLTILFLQPMCYLTWIWLGYWLPSVQYAQLWCKIFGGTLP